MGDLIRIDKATPGTPMDELLLKQLDAQQKGMLHMAMLLRETNERIKALEAEVHRLTKVTPQQANTINAAIRQRAKEVCRIHHAVGGENVAAAAIRKSMKATCGAGSAREVLRSDFQVAMRAVQLWDDYKVMEAIRDKL